jgi:hypothetical protein
MKMLSLSMLQVVNMNSRVFRNVTAERLVGYLHRGLSDMMLKDSRKKIYTVDGGNILGSISAQKHKLHDVTF